MAKQLKAIKDDITLVEKFEFEPIKGYPMLNWKGKRPFRSTQYYPAQLKEVHGEETNGWLNEIYWGDNLQVMSHLLKQYRGKIDFIYIDPPFDSKADYKLKIKTKGKQIQNDTSSFEEKQYTDIWSNDEYLQFMYERIILMRELLSDSGCIYLHCDYRKHHQLRCIMDEIFGESNFLNSLVWMFSTRSAIKSTWKRTHNDILFYKKSQDPVFNWDDEMVLEPLSENTIKKYKLEDEFGKYRLNGRNITGSPIRSAKDVDPKWEKTNPEWVVRDYLREGKSASDYFFIDIENQASNIRTDYPTQKPEELLYKLIRASTRPGGLVFDCFMGSGTTQAVAMKLGRKFIGADINLGSIQTTTKRLINTASDLKSNNDKKIVQLSLAAEDEAEYSKGKEVKLHYTGFSVYNVNNYDIFRNPVQAKDLLIEALEIQPYPTGSFWDGEKDGRKIRIMPINRIATKVDLNEIIANIPWEEYNKKHQEFPTRPVDFITLVCMGHEPDLAGALQMAMNNIKIDIEVVDILRDKTNLIFKRDSEAKIDVKKDKVVIKNFYPMNLLQKLSLMKKDVEEWRELVDSVMIDFNYDGAVFTPTVVDVPENDEMVAGEYEIPEDAGNIKIKITDLLSETFEKVIEHGNQ